jgi:hypothetical protein
MSPHLPLEEVEVVPREVAVRPVEVDLGILSGESLGVGGTAAAIGKRIGIGIGPTDPLALTWIQNYKMR